MSVHVAVMGIKGLPAKGGGERAAEAIISKALEQGFKVTVYGKKSYCEEYNNGNKLEIVTIRDFKGKHLNAFLYGVFSAFHALLLGKYDLIHLHYADFGYLVPLLRLRYKVIATSQGAEYERDKWGKTAKMFFKISEIPFIRFSNVITSASKSLAEYYENKYHKNIVYIPNGVELKSYDGSPEEIYKKYNLTENGYILFAAGRIIPSKGCATLLKAARELNLKVPLVIIGDMEGDQSYKKYLQSLSLTNVKFIKFIKSKEELFKIVKGCKFFIHPSTYEAMSLMLLEVGMLKKPIICSDIIQNIDAISNNAVYFTVGDVGSLVSKIQYALNNPEALALNSENAYKWITENRNADEISKIYLKIFEDMCLH
jgi:glycosyltransferase involved in cell wall biosynthesis